MSKAGSDPQLEVQLRQQAIKPARLTTGAALNNKFHNKRALDSDRRRLRHDRKSLREIEQKMKYFEHKCDRMLPKSIKSRANPSNSGSVATNGIVPVNPPCITPLIVPIHEPKNAGVAFVSLIDGSIQNPGIQPDGSRT